MLPTDKPHLNCVCADAGSLIFNPFNAWLLKSFDWRVAFRVSAGIVLIVGTLCCWCFSARETPAMERLEESTASSPECEEPEEEVYM